MSYLPAERDEFFEKGKSIGESRMEALVSRVDYELINLGILLRKNYPGDDDALTRLNLIREGVGLALMAMRSVIGDEEWTNYANRVRHLIKQLPTLYWKGQLHGSVETYNQVPKQQLPGQLLVQGEEVPENDSGQEPSGRLDSGLL